jgi:hypothetical protein
MQQKMLQRVYKMEDSLDKAITVNLCDIKRLKSTKTWRISFDIYAQDDSKVKALIDQIDKDFYLVLVPMGIDKSQNIA